MQDCNDPCLSFEQIVEKVLNKWIENGLISPGLLGCEGNNHLVQDERVVLCAELIREVQEGLDSGELEIAKLDRLVLQESTLTAHLTDGTEVSVDLASLLDKVPVVTSVATNDAGELVITLSDGSTISTDKSLKTLVYGTLKLCDGTVNNAETIFVTCDYLSTLLTNLGTSLQTWVRNYIRNILENTYTKSKTDGETIVGDGTETSPIRLNLEWLEDYLDEWSKTSLIKGGEYGQIYATDKNGKTAWINLKDCNDEPIHVYEQKLVTCENLDDRVPAVVLDDAGKVLVVLPDGTTGWINLKDCNDQGINVNDAQFVTCAYLETKLPSDGLPGQVLTYNEDGTFSWAWAKVEAEEGIKGDGTPDNPLSADEDWFDERYVRKDRNLMDCIIALDAHLSSYRSSTIEGLSVVGYGFSMGNTDAASQGATLPLSPSLCSLTGSTDPEAYIWPERNEARHIVIPIHDCEGAVIGYASSLPFIVLQDCE